MDQTLHQEQAPGTFALLSDGACVQIRAAAPTDWQAVHDFVDALGRESIFRRFFGYPSRPGKIIADSVCSPAPEGVPKPRGGLLALLNGEIAGIAEWIRADDPREAEIAFAVADRLHGHGVATLLAEHLLDAAEHAGVHRLTAITQAENYPMLNVFGALGIPATRSLDYGTWALSIDLDMDAARRVAMLDTVARRERSADEVSLRHFFDPAAVIVCGAPEDPATVAALQNAAGYGRPVWTGGPDGDGLPAGAAAPLAVLIGPPGQAADAVRRCARHGVQAVIVTATRFSVEQGRALLDACRVDGVRLLGPGSLGVAVPGRNLNAGLAPARVDAGSVGAGPVGVVVQSGGVGLALLAHLARLGVGVSSFAAVGEKYDVSANDVLMHWEGDETTRLGLIHLESFGNPRKFARTARRLSRTTALLAVDPGAAADGARAALYRQAGVVTVPSLGALVDAAALLACQPAPADNRVAVVGNTHGMVTLAVQACAAAGLAVVRAVDVTPSADAGGVRRVVEQAAASGGCDAVLVALAPTVPGAPFEALDRGAAGEGVTVVAVLTDQAETVAVPDAGDQDAVTGRRVPRFNDAAHAAAALAAALATSRVRGRDAGSAPVVSPVDAEGAHRMIESWLTEFPRGRALHPSERAQLLASFDIELTPAPPRPTADDRVLRLAVTAWQDPVFGPLLSCAPEGRAAAGGTLLVPTSAEDIRALADQALSAVAVPDGTRGSLPDLLARAALMVDGCPQLKAARLTAEVDCGGVARVTDAEMAVAPGERTDPYLRRLRRAPVE